MSERTLDTPTNRELLDQLLTLPGSTGDTYGRFYRYSPRNVGFLVLQGCPPEPVATFKRWGDLGRHIKRGSKAFSILRPIQVKIEDAESGETKLIRRFKVVKALFAASQTAGEQLPPYHPPEWTPDRMLSRLAIEQVAFENYDGNVQGYSFGRSVAVSPVAAYPLPTLLHECAHVEHGHTTDDELPSYQQHRGVREFEAEASAHVVANELGVLTDEKRSVSRAYCQGWLRDEKPSEASARAVLSVATTILNAGYEPDGDHDA